MKLNSVPLLFEVLSMGSLKCEWCFYTSDYATHW